MGKNLERSPFCRPREHVPTMACTHVQWVCVRVCPLHRTSPLTCVHMALPALSPCERLPVWAGMALSCASLTICESLLLFTLSHG